jgi:hypothetical protein
MDLTEIGLGVCGLDSTGSGQGPVAGCCECGLVRISYICVSVSRCGFGWDRWPPTEQPTRPKKAVINHAPLAACVDHFMYVIHMQMFS